MRGVDASNVVARIQFFLPAYKGSKHSAHLLQMTVRYVTESHKAIWQQR
jgi:hypothetical protein